MVGWYEYFLQKKYLVTTWISKCLLREWNNQMGIGDCSVFVVNLKVLPIFQNMNACTLDEVIINSKDLIWDNLNEMDIVDNFWNYKQNEIQIHGVVCSLFVYSVTSFLVRPNPQLFMASCLAMGNICSDWYKWLFRMWFLEPDKSFYL